MVSARSLSESFSKLLTEFIQHRLIILKRRAWSKVGNRAAKFVAFPVQESFEPRGPIRPHSGPFLH